MAAVHKIGFLGAGRMATALAQGIIRGGLASPAEIVASDLDPAARASFAKATGATVTPENRECAAAETVVLAVKPAQALEALRELRDIPGRPLLISIAAGIPLSELESAAAPGWRVVRVMPNTPALVGASATAFALGAECGPEDGQRVHDLFASVGIVVQVKESLLDAVTGLSGSGPAYGYLILEAMSDGGVACGLPRETATLLAAQTLLGAARMVLETGSHPGVLKDQVTSPGGTTIEGIHELERAGVRAGLMNAVRAAAEKSRRLGQR
jgi:pyrroline-5-carboxylate reductase